MAIDSNYVSTPFGRFHVEAAGSGKSLLLIHGGTASARDGHAVHHANALYSPGDAVAIRNVYVWPAVFE